MAACQAWAWSRISPKRWSSTLARLTLRGGRRRCWPRPRNPKLTMASNRAATLADQLRVVVVDGRDQLDLRRTARCPTACELGGLPAAGAGHLPQARPAEAPPERQVGAVGEVLAVGRDRGVLQRRVRSRGTRRGARAPRSPGRRWRCRPAAAAAGSAHQRARKVAPPSVSDWYSAVGVVEQELRRAERVLVERRQLVLLVRAAARRGVAAGLRVRRHVEHAQVERHRRGLHQLGVVGLLGQQVQRRDVLQHVDVAVPLEEARAGRARAPTRGCRAWRAPCARHR
jgi:hypothetical protein